MISFCNYTLIDPRKNNDISLYSGLFEKSPTVLREAIFTTPYSGQNNDIIVATYMVFHVQHYVFVVSIPMLIFPFLCKDFNPL